MTSQRKPGQIRCNSTLTVSGQPCKKYRPLDKQCAVEQHKRTWDEIERIAREHCLRTGDPLPASFGDLADKLNADRQSWLVEYKLLGCRYGMGKQAAINAGITEDPKQFAYHARHAMQPEISAWLDEQAMPANEAMQRLAEIARNEISQFYEPTCLDPELEAYLKSRIEAKTIDPDVASRILAPITQIALNAAAVVEAGRADLIHGVKTDKDGNILSYETGNVQDALNTIIDCHGLKKQKVEHTGKDGGPIESVLTMTPEQQAQAMIDLIAKGRANLSDNPE